VLRPSEFRNRIALFSVPEKVFDLNGSYPDLSPPWISSPLVLISYNSDLYINSWVLTVRKMGDFRVSPSPGRSGSAQVDF
jgi:hypothetical protein